MFVLQSQMAGSRTSVFDISLRNTLALLSLIHIGSRGSASGASFCGLHTIVPQSLMRSGRGSAATRRSYGCTPGVDLKGKLTRALISMIAPFCMSFHLSRLICPPGSHPRQSVIRNCARSINEPLLLMKRKHADSISNLYCDGTKTLSLRAVRNILLECTRSRHATRKN